MNSKVKIRRETETDIDVIFALVTAAFKRAEHRGGNEQLIVNELRRTNDLSVSLVAEIGNRIVGHIAASPVLINQQTENWFGLGPVAVTPARQNQGIGSLLVNGCLTELKKNGARGCVVLGDPGFYGRFGFSRSENLFLRDVPPAYFQVREFQTGSIVGEVTYNPAFYIAV